MRIKTPGRRLASHSIWKPLQIPITGPPCGGELLYGRHYWREPCDGARPQVVAIGEAAGENDAVKTRGQVRGFVMPEVLGPLAQHVFEDVVAVGVAPCAGENNDSEAHVTLQRSPPND